MSFTLYARKKILDDLCGVAAFAWPNLYLSLHTADPGVAGSHAFEVSGGSYARQPLSGVMGAADLSTGISVNTVVISFGPASADWGTVIFLGLEDALSAGNMIAPAIPATPRTITTGQPFQIPVGQFQLRLA